MTIRPSRVFAIAARDLRHELKGRRGLLFPAVLAGLLIPTATVRPPPILPTLAGGNAIQLTGEVPAAIREAYPPNDDPKTRRLDFARHPDGALIVRGGIVPVEMRDLGWGAAALRLERSGPMRVPGRSLLFALLGIPLTGPPALSAASGRPAPPPADRSREPGRIVLGKCVAWDARALASLLAIPWRSFWAT